MKVYITKHALTHGIKEVNDACEKTEMSLILVPSMGVFAYFHGEGREWHRTREAAVKRAEQMRAAKLASLRRQIDRLERMEFK